MRSVGAVRVVPLRRPAPVSSRPGSGSGVAMKMMSAAAPVFFKVRCYPSTLARSCPIFVSQQNQFPFHSTRNYTSASNMASATSFYDFKPLDKRGQEVALSDYKGKVVLIVNTASKCGFTGQYAGLEKIYKGITEKNPDDFVILGFPCNQFGSQEPGTDEEIQSFCQINYGVSFPIMQKIDVNGDNAAPLYEWLKSEKSGLLGLKRIKWNFEKFLVGRDGKVVNRWASTSTPEGLEKDILAEISKKPAA